MSAHAMHIFGDEIRDNLDIVRVIRNAFAHSKRLIDFSFPLVVKELHRIKIPKTSRKAFREIKTKKPEDAYVSLCMQLTIELIRRRTSATVRSTNRAMKKSLATSPLARALAPSLGLTPFGSLVPYATPLGSPPVLLAPNQSGDPKTEAPLGMLAELFRKHSKNGDKTDN